MIFYRQTILSLIFRKNYQKFINSLIYMLMLFFQCLFNSNVF